jgi:thiol-disulfide isomerase/thioredoxin
MSLFKKFSVIISFFLLCCCISCDNIKPPFSDHPGYIADGLNFDAPISDAVGLQTSIKQLAGNVVIVAFYTTWCHNCPDVIQSLDVLAEYLKKKNVNNVKIFALNLGNENAAQLYEHFQDLRIQRLSVYQSISPRAIKGIQGVPTTLIFNKSGKPVCGYVGGNINFSSVQFFDFITRLAK